MDEERFIKTGADTMTLLITERLGERKRKLNRMAEMEREIRAKKNRRNYITRPLLAASILAALFAWPIYRAQMSPLDRLGIQPPATTEYRTANTETAEIALLMENKDYEQALAQTKNALDKSDLAIKELRGVSIDWNNEELMYEENLERSANSELRWTYIYLLVKLRQNKDAKKQLKRYIKDKQFSEHRTEAIALLKEISK